METQIDEYEQQYQNEFRQLESIVSNSNTENDSSALHLIKSYLDEQTNELKRTMRDKVSSSRNRLLQNRQRASSSKNTIGVSPEPYLDVISNPFDQREWNYLSLGKKFCASIMTIFVFSSF